LGGRCLPRPGVREIYVPQAKQIRRRWRSSVNTSVVIILYVVSG
jgi:hypothetical protein